MYQNQQNHGDFANTSALLRRRPQAWAKMEGRLTNTDIQGMVRFYQTAYGVLVVAEIGGLPKSADLCEGPIFGFHIHEGNTCTGNASDPFADTGSHYDPYDCRHPYHSGDLPPLFGANGYAFSAFLTDRFTVNEIIGKTVIIHAMADDFTTQPSGNAGQKIACGEIGR